MSVVCILYTVVAWGFVDWFPAFFIRIFNREGDMVEAGIPAIRMYFFGFFMMSLQFAGQSVFVGLGKSRNAVFFHFPQGYHCHTPYHHTAHCIRNGNPGHTDGRAHIQLYRGRRLLRDHAAHCVA